MNHDEWKTWREERQAKLKEPFGWLSLVSLDWLDDHPQQLENFPGTWSATGHTVTWNDEVIEVPEGGQVFREAEGKQAEIASRFGKICVRIRDPHSPTLTEFTGTDTFDFTPEAQLKGDFLAYDQPVVLEVPSAYPGGTVSLTAIGEISTHGNPPLVVTESHDGLAVIFTDPTNDEWRVAPVEDNVIDFNRAVFFPAHFTPYGTCPTPPPGNHLAHLVEAGERR